jgi:hypothetical protein
MSTQQQASQPDPAQPPTPTPTQPSSVATFSQMSVVEEPVEPPPLQLSPEQQLVLTKVTRRENVFFTGPAGEHECGERLFLILLKGGI